MNRTIDPSRAADPTLSRRQFVTGTIACVAAGGLAQSLTAKSFGAPVAGSSAGMATLLHNEAAWAHFLAGMKKKAASAAELDRQAAEWRARPVATIVDKKHAAPSGDPHDYVSVAPYTWPDPKKADGLPWITRDGEVNPTFYEYDNPALEALCHAVPALALNAFATGASIEATHAGRRLRAWFVDAETRMNPHLQFAQMVPGRNQGSAGGIIDTTSLVFLADAITRLPLGEDWTESDMKQTREWFANYTDWLLHSANGRKEGAALNNHGTWYDAQVAAFACVAGDDAVARDQIRSATPKRIARQIEADGRQPAELKRTLALTYTTYNLLGFACVAQIARRYDIDLWRESCDGRRLIDALKWMLPYYAKKATWTHPQIKPFEYSNASLLLNLAWQATGEREFAEVRDLVSKHPWDAITFSKASLAARKPPGAPQH